MLTLDMEQERKRHGYEVGLTAPRMGKNFKEIKNFIDSNDYPLYSGIPMTISKVKRQTREFFTTLFKVHNVYILPEKHEQLFDRYLGSKVKTTEGFSSLILKYATYESPFYIPIKQEALDPYYSGLICYFPDGLDEEALPILNSKIVMSAYTNISPSFYVNQICSTQLDGVRGSVPNFHDREVLSILMEKILAYESRENIFPIIENYRMHELKLDMSLIKEDSKNNVIWSFIISTIKAEELFDYYISLSDNDKREFFQTIQRIFDGEISLNELLDNGEISLESERAIPAIKRNLSLK